MKKLPAKVFGDVIENTNVRSRLHLLVWNMFITPDTFESTWHYLIEKFGLQDNEWLNNMFEIRDRWVPAYFREIPFCCLMKTTSRCESSNATFKVNSTSANTLVQFMLCMEFRLDSQRYSQRNFRKEIMKGKYCCYVTNTETVDAHVLYSVTHLDKRKDITNVFMVNFDLADNSASCSCMGFTRIGFLCRHVFCVYRIKIVDKIPLKYVSDRWKQDVLPRSVFLLSNRFSVDSNPQIVLRFEVLEMVSQCVDMLRVESEGLNSFAMKIKEFKSVFFEKSFKNADVVDDTEYVFEEIVGKVNEGDVFIKNPDDVRTKGCGKVRRVSGESEKIVEKAGKVARLCRSCGEYVHHDSHNCPLNPKNNKKKSLAELEASDNV
ncbi:protein FAR1-RELATED SEQUENCE 5-like [Bidens hawaiensis]|uniref:protein FAR1-RELATED SEQUENCE 5-like n=1 Tax=Bidens hawaiensis TaxID=980011 RepID=UPI00404A9FEF